MTDTTPAPHTPLRVEVGPDGRLCLEPDQAIRLVLALKHLGSFTHWSPHAKPYDEAIADEAEWMAETLGDAALSDAGPPPRPGA